ncbi:MAG: acyl-ACP--UDP-N-acetylglucosamine O-acyltransferase [Chromatiales bacterium]|jgi:UDP-N-acetylglucosamine acyltransferase
MPVHPTAIVDPSAEIHPSAEVGPYCIVEGDVVIGEGCVLESGVRVYAGTRMGRGNRVHHDAVLGAPPQDLSYDPARRTLLEIGEDNTFREFVSVHRGSKEERTVVGSGNYLMAQAHIAHDCRVGDANVFANGALLGGHVRVAHHAFLSGHTAVHQFCRIGPYAMVAGVTGVPRDVPPFVTADGHRAEIVGLNLVGLKRAGFDQERRTAIKRAYRLIYKSGLSLAGALERLRADEGCGEALEIADFFESSRRGVIPHR